MRKRARPPAGMLMIAGRAAKSASGRRRSRREWTGCNCVGIAAAVEQEVLVLHVGEPFGIESHAHEVKVRIKSMNLKRVLDIVGCGAIPVVVGVFGAPRWHRYLLPEEDSCREYLHLGCRQSADRVAALEARHKA